MEILYTELRRRELYQQILSDLQGTFNKDGKKYTETGKLLARWIFNCLIEPSSSDPVFQTGNKYSRKGLEEDFSYLGLHSTYGGPETTGKQFDILLTDAYNKLNSDSLKERIKEDITKNEKIEIKNGKLVFRGETYPDLGGLGIKEDTRPYALALQIRYKYLGIDTLGLACDYQLMGYKKTDNVLEGFASAFNHYFQRWCSAFPDLETVFGSEGSFWKHKLDEKIVLLNPPFDNILIEQMFEKVRNSLETSSFNAVIPAWLDSPPILRLFEDSRVKRIIIYEKGKVQFIDYMKGVKFSPCGIIEVMLCK